MSFWDLPQIPAASIPPVCTHSHRPLGTYRGAQTHSIIVILLDTMTNSQGANTPRHEVNTQTQTRMLSLLCTHQFLVTNSCHLVVFPRAYTNNTVVPPQPWVSQTSTNSTHTASPVHTKANTDSHQSPPTCPHPTCTHKHARTHGKTQLSEAHTQNTPAPGPQPQSPGLPFLAGEGGEGLGMLGAGSALVPSLRRLARSFLSGRVSQPSRAPAALAVLGKLSQRAGLG